MEAEQKCPEYLHPILWFPLQVLRSQTGHTGKRRTTGVPRFLFLGQEHGWVALLSTILSGILQILMHHVCAEGWNLP